ncbi:RDD family protein [Streptomyces venezuelae]|uniref:RDD family protein n=1 Tax=Streptomyces venezuelae TaxID=54571 RepID=A0A5P2CLB8_STRVZ|nr:RDD family protein [Streptomyces venezuelae]QES42508.1 RDD family protein [Streptomyces venezuelae]
MNGDAAHAGDGAWQARGRPAGLVSRLVAAAIDALVVAVLGVLLHLGASALVLVVTGPPFRTLDPPAWVTAACGTAIALGYAAGSWATTGRTAGGQVMGLRVSARSGQLLRAAPATLRAALCLALPAGLLWIPLSRRNASVQDLLVRSRVVYDWTPRSPAVSAYRRTAP